MFQTSPNTFITLDTFNNLKVIKTSYRCFKNFNYERKVKTSHIPNYVQFRDDFSMTYCTRMCVMCFFLSSLSTPPYIFYTSICGAPLFSVHLLPYTIRICFLCTRFSPWIMFTYHRIPTLPTLPNLKRDWLGNMKKYDRQKCSLQHSNPMPLSLDCRLPIDACKKCVTYLLSSTSYCSQPPRDQIAKRSLFIFSML